MFFRRRFLEHAAFSIPVVSFVLLSSLTLLVAIRRFYLAKGKWGGRLLSVATSLLLYVLNTVFMTAVQVAGAAIALALI